MCVKLLCRAACMRHSDICAASRMHVRSQRVPGSSGPLPAKLTRRHVLQNKVHQELQPCWGEVVADAEVL